MGITSEFKVNETENDVFHYFMLYMDYDVYYDISYYHRIRRKKQNKVLQCYVERTMVVSLLIISTKD